MTQKQKISLIIVCCMGFCDVVGQLGNALIAHENWRPLVGAICVSLSTTVGGKVLHYLMDMVQVKGDTETHEIDIVATHNSPRSGRILPADAKGGDDTGQPRVDHITVTDTTPEK